MEGNLYDIKTQFKKNIFSLELKEENAGVTQLLNEHFELLESTALPHSIQYRIHIPDGKRANDLIAAVMQHADILSFNEILPSMNEIFIEQVETFNQAHAHEQQ